MCWHSPASVSRFEETLAIALPEAAARAVRAHPEVIGVWLFGSRARGAAGPRSDVDLLLLVERGRARPMDRLLDYGDLVDAVPAPVDLLVLTPSELARMRDEPFYRRLLAEARPLACRSGTAPPAGLGCP